MTDPTYLKPVSLRRTVDGAVSEEVTPLVLCPASASIVELTRCTGCGHGHGLILNSETRELEAICDKASEHEPERNDSPAAVFSLVQRPVSQVMQTNVTCFTTRTPLHRVAETLRRAGFSGGPVVNENGRLIGTISLLDVVKGQPLETGSTTAESQVLAGDVMTVGSCALPEHAEVARAAAVMACEGVHHVPIVSPQRNVVGIISALDILRTIAADSGFVVPAAPRSAARCHADPAE